MDTCVGIQRDDQRVTERARLLEKLDMAGMQNIVAAVGEDHRFALFAPVVAEKKQLIPRADSSHRAEVPLQCNAAIRRCGKVR